MKPLSAIDLYLKYAISKQEARILLREHFILDTVSLNSEHEIVTEYFLLHYSYDKFFTRMNEDAKIVVDGIPYQVVWVDTTPATMLKNQHSVTCSFRYFNNEFGLPPMVLVKKL